MMRRWTRGFAFVIVLALPLSMAGGEQSPPTRAQLLLLDGAIDFHCHSGPDVVARVSDDLELVRLAAQSGLRALVIKNHYTMTADRAELAMSDGGSVQVFGGIVLNLSVGGLNLEAVRAMSEMTGGRGKVVWLPTRDSENEVRRSGERRPFVAVVRDGQPVPELEPILRLIAERDLILATGHSSADESLLLLRAAKAAGVRRMLVTHVLSPTIGATLDHLREFAAMGTVMECVWLTHVPTWRPPGLTVDPAIRRSNVPVADAVDAIRRIGFEHFIIASDFGQVVNPPPPDGLADFIAALLAGGLTEAEIEGLVRRTPARLLGLEP